MAVPQTQEPGRRVWGRACVRVPAKGESSYGDEGRHSSPLNCHCSFIPSFCLEYCIFSLKLSRWTLGASSASR